MEKKNKQKGFLRITGGVVLGGVIILGSCIETVSAGYAGVVYSPNGGVNGEVLSQGWHLVNPLKKVIEYPISTETMYLSFYKVEGSKEDDSYTVPTSDGKMVSVDAGLSYSYNPDMLNEVFTKWRGRKPSEIENTYLAERVKAISKNITSQYSVSELYGNKINEINGKIQTALKEELAAVGIVIENFSFTEVRLDDDTRASIQAKVDAQQKLEQAKIEAENVKIEAEKKVAQAEAEAKAKRIQAQGEADALIISAQAQKESNELIAQSLTEEVLRLKELQKWDGVLPMVTGEATPIITIGE